MNEFRGELFKYYVGLFLSFIAVVLLFMPIFSNLVISYFSPRYAGKAFFFPIVFGAYCIFRIYKIKGVLSGESSYDELVSERDNVESFSVWLMKIACGISFGIFGFTVFFLMIYFISSLFI